MVKYNIEGPDEWKNNWNVQNIESAVAKCWKCGVVKHAKSEITAKGRITRNKKAIGTMTWCLQCGNLKGQIYFQRMSLIKKLKTLEFKDLLNVQSIRSIDYKYMPVIVLGLVILLVSVFALLSPAFT